MFRKQQILSLLEVYKEITFYSLLQGKKGEQNLYKRKGQGKYVGNGERRRKTCLPGKTSACLNLQKITTKKLKNKNKRKSEKDWEENNLAFTSKKKPIK